MTLPHVLLVDDSEAILAYEKAALSGLYAITTATNGDEGLARARALRPAAIVLDLSMPGMNGEQVLAHLKADTELARTPVVIVSSEQERAEACVKDGGASGFLTKPIRAHDLRVLIARVLDDVHRSERQGNLAVLFIDVGPLALALPLDCVYMIVHQPETQPLPAGPSYLREMFELEGSPVAILDLARRLRVQHSESIIDRKLVIIDEGAVRIALCVDRVRDPEEFSASNVVHKEVLGGGEHGVLGSVLRAVVKTTDGPVPVIAPSALTTQSLLRKLPDLLRAASSVPMHEEG